MANKALKGLTIKIGGDTSDLLKSLDNVDKRSRSLSSELGQINKLLKLDPKNTELLAQKQKVLADAISSTEDRLGTLKEAEKQVQEQFERGEVSEAQYRALQREIIATESKLDKYKAAAREAAEASRQMADGADEAARELDDQAEKTQEAEEAAEDLDDVAGDLAKGGLAALAGAAAAATAAVIALAEESREYRTAMGRLDVAFQDANFSAEAARSTYEELQSVLGETDQAVEASNLLAKFCDTEEELKDMTHALTGVFATFPDSLPIEALAESANETARTGKIAGNLADALNWAAAEGEKFGVTMKAATEENEEWNKAVEEAASAEDYFNLALQECSSEQERQKLITDTLTKLYGKAADQYKRTNKEVIRANQATENWNKATAKIGKTVEPVITDIKELGVTLLEDAEEPLEDTAKFIRTELIPAIRDVSSWTKKNLPQIKAGLTGVATAMVALKVASVATTVAQKGLKKAIASTTVAQKALTLAQKATPWGLVATAVAGLTAAMIAYSAAAKDARVKATVLTEAEQELIAEAKEAADAFRDQQESTQDAMATTYQETRTVQKMADELRDLAGASGEVEEADRDRAELLLGKLNDALGTEYEMVGGVIQQYDELKNSIDTLIQSKLANALIDDGMADYIAAQKEIAAANKAMTDTERDYKAQVDETFNARAAYVEAYEAWQQSMESGDHYAVEYAAAQLMLAQSAWEEEVEILNDKEAKYNEAKANYQNYSDTIIDYETAQRFAAEGNYEAVKDILLNKGEIYGDYGDTVDAETARVLDTLEMEAILAGEKAKKFKEEFEAGSDGYTEEMVTEAEEGYKEALDKFATAYSDAYGLGEDFGQGLADGIKIKNGAVGAAAIAQIREAVKAAKKEAEINSPSKKTMAIGEGMGEGAEVGLEHTTKDVKRAATDQAAAILDAYSAQELAGQRALRNVADQQAARQITTQMNAAASNAPMLEKILTAIEKGQLITIDGEALVGATASRMDSALGNRRTLASRGAI